MSTALSLPQPLRFLLAGGLAAGLNWTVRFPLSAVMPFLPAVISATIIGMSFGFVTYRLLVFPGSSSPLVRQIRDFVTVNLSSLLLVAAVAALFRSLLMLVSASDVVEPTAHAAGIAVGAVFNYFGHHVMTFRKT